MEKIDARGLSCPQPVVLTQRAISAGKKKFDIVVDSEVCRENVVRFIKGKFNVDPTISTDGDTTVISVSIK